MLLIKLCFYANVHGILGFRFFKNESLVIMINLVYLSFYLPACLYITAHFLRNYIIGIDCQVQEKLIENGHDPSRNLSSAVRHSLYFQIKFFLFVIWIFDLYKTLHLFCFFKNVATNINKLSYYLLPLFQSDCKINVSTVHTI